LSRMIDLLMQFWRTCGYQRFGHLATTLCAKDYSV
jgi:hypothetical protein